MAKKKGPLEKPVVKAMLDKVDPSSEDALVDRVWGVVCHRPRVSIPAIPFLRKAIEKVELVLQSLDPWIEKGKKKRSSDSLTTSIEQIASALGESLSPNASPSLSSSSLRESFSPNASSSSSSLRHSAPTTNRKPSCTCGNQRPSSSTGSSMGHLQNFTKMKDSKNPSLCQPP